MKLRNVAIPLLALLWLALAVSLYYLTHTPFTRTLAANLLRAAWQILLAVLIASVSGALGGRLLPDLPLQPLVRLAFRTAFGMGILSLAILAIGATLGFNLIVGWLLLALLILALRKQWLGWWRAWRALPDLWVEAGLLGRSLAIATVLIAGFALIVALAPPLKFDSLVYHLVLPRLYLAQERIAYVPEIMYWGFPQLPHMHYLWSFALGGYRSAVIGWMMGALAIVGLVAYVGQCVSVRHGWVAAAALVGGFSLAASLAWGYVDWPSILMGWGFVVSLDLFRQTAERKYLWLSGTFAAFAFGTKYTAGILFLTGLGVLFYYAWKTRARLLRTLWPYLLAAALFASPWLLKNLLATGNPFYPLLLPGGAMSQTRLEMFQGQPIQGDWRDLVLLPLRATYWGVELAHVGEGGPGYEASIGPLLLGFGALAWVGWKSFPEVQRRFFSTAALVCVQGLVIWAVAGRLSGHLIRTHLYYSLFPAFALLAVAGFAGLERRSLPGVRLGRVAAVLLSLVLALNLIQVGVDVFEKGAPRYLLGLKSEHEYLNDNLGVYNLAMEAIDDLPSGSRVLMLWEARGYYCMPICRSDEALDSWLDDLHSVNSPAGIPDFWRGQGFTHVLFFRLGADFIRETDPRYTIDDWQALETVLAGLTLHTDFNGAYQLYSLSP